LYLGLKEKITLGKVKIGIFLPNPKEWFGGVNYYLRLCAVLNRYSNNINCIVFYSDDLPSSVVNRFSSLTNSQLIKINRTKQSSSRILQSLFLGKDKYADQLFKIYKLDYIIESGAFYGWRFNESIISWIPDLQHVFLKDHFSFTSRFKRDIGFFIQRLTRRKIYFSSFDALKSFSSRYYKPFDSLFAVRFSVSKDETSSITEDMINQTVSKYSLNKRYIYFPSQIWAHKNHLLLIKSLGEIQKSGRNVDFQIVSSGNTNDFRDTRFFNSLLTLREELNLTEDDFKFLGQIPFEDVQSLMSGCEAVINPSLFEGWSTTVEEARSINKTLILSNINIHKEQGPDNTYYFKSNDVTSLSNTLLELNDKISTNNIKDEDMSDSFQKRFYNDFMSLLV